MPTVRPFANIGGHTIFDNAALDLVMPKCKPNTWKIVCATLRKTAGWSDPHSPTGRKQSDLISLSQYKKLTGIESQQTLVNAIADALNNGFIVRFPAGQSFRYAINYLYEIQTSTEIELVTRLKIVQEPVRKSNTQNKLLNKSSKTKRKDILGAGINPENIQPPLISDMGEAGEGQPGPTVQPKRGPGRPRKNPASVTPIREEKRPASESKAQPDPDGTGQDQTPQVAPNPPAKPAKSAPPVKVQDPRELHPAVVAIRELVNRRGFPYPETWDLIIAKLGDSPDRERLKTCYAVWRSKDYRITMLPWALEWYGNPPPEVLAALAPAAQAIRRIPAIRDQNGNLLEPEAAIAAWGKMEAARRAKLTNGRETNDATTATKDVSAGR